MHEVDAPAEQDAVVLERERLLHDRAVERGQPARERRVAPVGDEAGDAVDLVVGRERVARAHGSREGVGLGRPRVAQVELLQQDVHGVADLGGRQPAGAGAARAPSRASSRGRIPATRSAK